MGARRRRGDEGVEILAKARLTLLADEPVPTTAPDPVAPRNVKSDLNP
jgi:hypothetical protein